MGRIAGRREVRATERVKRGAAREKARRESIVKMGDVWLMKRTRKSCGLRSEAGGHAKPFPWLSPAPPADLPFSILQSILVDRHITCGVLHAIVIETVVLYLLVSNFVLHVRPIAHERKENEDIRIMTCHWEGRSNPSSLHPARGEQISQD